MKRGINGLTRAELISCYDTFIQSEGKYFFTRFAGHGRPKYFSRETDWSTFAIKECRNQIIKANINLNNDEMLENLSIFLCDSSLKYQQKMGYSKVTNQFNDPFYIAHEIIEEFIDFLINVFGFDGIRWE